MYYYVDNGGQIGGAIVKEVKVMLTSVERIVEFVNITKTASPINLFKTPSYLVIIG